MTSPTSQAVTPTDGKLEELVDELEQAVATYAIYQNTSSRQVVSLRLTAARAALREYVSEDTQRLDWLESECLTIAPADTYLALEYQSGLSLRDGIDSNRPAAPQ